MVFDGAPNDALNFYSRLLFDRESPLPRPAVRSRRTATAPPPFGRQRSPHRRGDDGDGSIATDRRRGASRASVLLGERGEPATVFESGEHVVVRFAVRQRARRWRGRSSPCASRTRRDSRSTGPIRSSRASTSTRSRPASSVVVEFDQHMNLMPGSYFLSTSFVEAIGDDIAPIDRRYDVLEFQGHTGRSQLRHRQPALAHHGATRLAGCVGVDGVRRRTRIARSPWAGFDGADIGAIEERWVLDRLEASRGATRWRRRVADNQPELYARLTDPVRPASYHCSRSAPRRCLDATGGWGQIAVPLARRARSSSGARGATRRDHPPHRRAGRRGVGVAVGASVMPVRRGHIRRAVLLHDRPYRRPHRRRRCGQHARSAVRRGAAAAPVGAQPTWPLPNPLAPLASAPSTVQRATRRVGHVRALHGAFAAAGLTAIAAYACFPDHERPRFFVPLALVDDFVRAMPRAAGGAGLTPIYAALADEGIARQFAPSFAFVLRPAGA